MQFSCQLYPCGNLFQINHIATLHVVSNTAMAVIGSDMAVCLLSGARLERQREPEVESASIARQSLQATAERSEYALSSRFAMQTCGAGSL
jgi:hypothetical protein